VKGATRLALACGMVATVLVTAVAAQKPPGRLGLGRAASPEEIRALDIDAMPDGRGLPSGRGTVAEGASVYAARCAACHGPRGEGGSADRLVGRNEGDSFAYATNPKLIRTIGSYWPYATTLYDYTARAMPFQRPGTLTANDTYSVVAYLLFQNGIIEEDAVMDQASLPKVVMPARDKFVPDNRTGGKVVKE
jgi:S-disulfanyl-L-cysteine oxidoreductase SoxD